MITVLALLGIGVLAGRLRGLPAGTAAVLDAVVINLALPGLVIALVPTLQLDAATAVPVATAWASLAVAAGLVLLLSRAAGWGPRTTGTLLLVVPLGNTSFLGIPAVEALLGVDHLPYALVYDQLGSFLALTTYGAYVAGRYGAGDPPRPGQMAGRLLRFPPFLALLVAGVLLVTGSPAVVEQTAGRLGATVTPLTMIAVGMRLRLPRRDPSLTPLAAGLAVRMAVVPALAYAAAAVLGGSGPAWETSVLEAAMPPMVTASVVATAAGLDERLAANLAGAGVVTAMATLPLWAWLVG